MYSKFAGFVHHIDYTHPIRPKRLYRTGFESVCGVVTSNRQKQEVGRRVALNALKTAYHTEVNAGPEYKTVEVVGGAYVVHISSSVAAKGAGAFNGSNDCTECCKQSAFETSADGNTWTRAIPTGVPLAMGGDIVEVSFPPSLFHPPKFLRYGYDALVQCPYFDADGLPLGPFQTPLP